MQKKTTMHSIALALGVSVVSVSKALSGKEGVSESLRESICKKAKELNYQYTAGASSTKKNHYTVGILVAERYFSDNGFYAVLYSKLVKALSDKACFSILEIVLPSAEEGAFIPQALGSGKIHGIIILGQMPFPYIQTILCHPIPAIFLDCYDPHIPNDTVLSNNTQGMFELTHHLIQNGHKKILFVGNIYATSSIMDRYLGYYKAMLAFHLPVPSLPFISDRTNDGALFEIPLPDPMPTAFVCNCDETAYYLLAQLKASGYNVPEDISVVGFDDFVFASLASPTLTTYSVDTARMAKSAAHMILQKMQNPRTTYDRHIVAGEMVLRHSVLPANEQKPNTAELFRIPNP